jgi:hypothetical protein
MPAARSMTCLTTHALRERAPSGWIRDGLPGGGILSSVGRARLSRMPFPARSPPRRAPAGILTCSEGAIQAGGWQLKPAGLPILGMNRPQFRYRAASRAHAFPFVLALAIGACARQAESGSSATPLAMPTAGAAVDVAAGKADDHAGAAADSGSGGGAARDAGAGAGGSRAGTGGAAASDTLADAVGAGTGGAAAGSGKAGAVATPTAGSGGASAGASAAGVAAPALGPDCSSDPLAGKQPYGSGFYQKFHGLFGCTPPADLALFRKMLPDKFEMPTDPQVCFYIIDFEISSVGSYHEAAILLPITYKGQSGKYVLTMDLDNRAATSGGRAIGFPKYQGQVSVERNGNDWTGIASANGTEDLKASYTGQCTKSDEILWPDFINLTPIPSGTSSSQAFLPPRTGKAVRVPAEYLSDKTFHSLKGDIKLEIGDHLPWNGLVDETKPFPGLWSAFVGGVDLGNQALD